MGFGAAFKEIFLFFFGQELRSRRTRILAILSFLPVLILVFARINEAADPTVTVTAESIFTRVLLLVYIQLLVPVSALIFGSMTINEELENKTLVLLTTAPVSRSAVVLGKFAAFVLVGIIIINLGLIAGFLVLNIDRLGSVRHVGAFLGFMGGGVLALAAYMALFTLLGTFMKKAGVVFGLMFIFGWENVVQYFPGMTQKLTVIHWVKSLLPTASDGSGGFLRFLVRRLEPSSTAESLVVLVLVIAAALTAAAVIFRKREYVISDAV